MDRDLAETTPHGVGSFNCYHPTMQKLALRLAVEPARRSGGVTVEAVVPGRPPSVRAQEDGQVRVLQARLAVGADERASRVRRWAGFTADREVSAVAIVDYRTSRRSREPFR